MKKLILLSVFFILFSSCKKECSPWHEGSNCTESRGKFFGKWYGDLHSNNDPFPYSGHPDSTWFETSADGFDKIIMEDQVICVLKSGTGGEIPFQVYNTGQTITGSFSTLNNEIDITFAVSDGSNVTNYSFHGIR